MPCSLPRVCSLLLTATVPVVLLASSAAQRTQYSSEHRQAERALTQQVTSTDARMKKKLALGRTGVSLIGADFDSDGTQDLVTGYAIGNSGVLLLQRGSSLATAPGEREHALLAAGQFITPYVERAEAIDVPVRPDLLKTADLSGHGHFDLLTAAQGDTSVYLLAGDGRGQFGAAKQLALSGAVTSLSTWRGMDGKGVILAGVCAGAGCGLQVLNAEGETLTFVKTRSAVTGMETAQLNLGGLEDLVLTTSDSVEVVDGRSLLEDKVPHIDAVPVTGAVAVATGTFAYDRRGYRQIAVLGADATLHVFARAGALDTSYTTRKDSYPLMAAGKLQATRAAVTSLRGMGWSEVETVPNVGPGGASALMMRGRFSGWGNDDLVVLAGGQYITVAHPTMSNGSVRTATPVVTMDSQSAPAVAAMAARITADARLGVVTMNSTARPLITAPTSGRQITLTTTADLVAYPANMNVCRLTQAPNGTTQCSLRAAIAVVNADYSTNGIGTSSIDKITMPAGTYTISTTNNGGTAKDMYGSVDYHYDVDAAVNIVGAGQGVTILSAGTIGYGGPPSTSGGNGIDSLIEQNSQIVNQPQPFDMFLSNLTIRNGKNPNNLTAANNFLENAYGGGLDFDSYGGGVLTMTNVTFSGNSIVNGPGGAIASFNTNGGQSLEGGVDLETSILTSNYSASGGGGLYMTDHIPLTVNASTISNNSSTLGNNTQGPESDGVAEGGGGITLQASASLAAVNINNSTFSGNTTDSYAGALNFASGATVTNTAFTGNSGAAFGGAIHGSPDGSPFNGTGLTFTANTINSTTRKIDSGASAGAPNGGAVCMMPSETNYPATVNINYSRFHGNSANGGAYTGFYDGCGTTSGELATTVNLANNWWGCNAAATGANCDTAGVQTPVAAGNAGETLTLSPFTVLTLTLSSTVPTYNTAFMATGSLGQNSASPTPGKATAAQAYAYNLTPATMAFSTINNPTISGTTFSSTANTGVSLAAITASANATPPGQGLATVTVDGCTIKDQGLLPTCNSSTTSNYTVDAADLTVTSTHTNPFKAGDSSDTYTLTVANTGNAPTSGTVTVSDTLPAGFTAVSIAGSGWTCTLSSISCTRSDQLSSSVTYPVVTVTVSIASTDTGTYNSTVTTSGGNEYNVYNDTSSDSTTVLGPPAIAEAFSPSSVGPNTNSTLTVTLTNPGSNTAALAGVAFSETLPTGLRLTGTVTTTCSGGTPGGTNGGATITLSGGSIPTGSSCTVTGTVASPSNGTYSATTNNVTATNTNAGGTATATLTVAVTPTRVVFTTIATTPNAAGGNAGTVQTALEDASGNVNTAVSGNTVSLQVTGPNGYSQTYSATTTNGVASFNLSSVSLTIAGSYNYTATSGALTQATSTEVVNPGATVGLTVSGLTSFGAPGVMETATVRAVDGYGNIVTGFTGTVTLTSSDALASFSPASYTFTASDAGVHPFTVALGTAGTQSVTATSGSFTGAQTGLVVSDAILVVSPSGTLSRFTDAGTATSPSAGYTGGGTPTIGAATDFVGNIFSLNATANRLVEFSKTGATLSGSGYTGGGLSTPNTLAIDGNGSIWIGNSKGTISQFTNGVAVSPASGYSSSAGTAAPAGSLSGVAIDNSGNVWLTNQTSSTVTEIIGGAAPVAPLATGVTGLSLGAKP